MNVLTGYSDRCRDDCVQLNANSFALSFNT
jgi:hypothetical protein